MLLLSAPPSDFPTVVLHTKTHLLTQTGDRTHQTCQVLLLLPPHTNIPFKSVLCSLCSLRGEPHPVCPEEAITSETYVIILSSSCFFSIVLQYIPSHVSVLQLLAPVFSLGWWLFIKSESCLWPESYLFFLIFLAPLLMPSIYLYALPAVPHFTCAQRVSFPSKYFFFLPPSETLSFSW